MKTRVAPRVEEVIDHGHAYAIHYIYSYEVCAVCRTEVDS